MTRDSFCQLAAYAGDGAERIDVPPPAVLKPTQLWTGRQLFSLIIRPNASGSWPCVSLECPERTYAGGDVEALCPNDGYVVVRRSKLIAGAVAKRTVGAGSKKGLVYRTEWRLRPETDTILPRHASRGSPSRSSRPPLSRIGDTTL